MAEEFNELNDIILNRETQRSSRTRTLVGVGTLAVVLILVIVFMSRGTEPAPTPLKLPEPTHKPVVDDAAVDAQLEVATQKAMSELNREDEIESIDYAEPVIVNEDTPSDVTPYRPSEPAPAVKPEPRPTPRPAVEASRVYVQVGSFSRYKPAPEFIARIEKAGYTYTYDRVAVNGKIINKLLIGPFADRNDAKKALTDIRKKVESGAFIYVK